MLQQTENTGKRFAMKKLFSKNNSIILILSAALLIVMIYIIAALSGILQLNNKTGWLTNASDKNLIVPLQMDYQIESSAAGGIRNGKLNDVCRSGDIIHLSVNSAPNCYVMVFCIDSMMIPLPVFPRGELEPVFFAGGKIPVPPFLLNEVTGTEIYYAVASKKKFSFRELTPYLDTALSKIEKLSRNPLSKGPTVAPFELRLPVKFTYDYIYFRHLPAELSSPAQCESKILPFK